MAADALALARRVERARRVEARHHGDRARERERDRRQRVRAGRARADDAAAIVADGADRPVARERVNVQVRDLDRHEIGAELRRAH